jgi:GNAT superfamily N-acetyltransferase
MSATSVLTVAPPGVLLLPVNAAERAEDVVRVHEATASMAYAHIFSEPFPRNEVLARWAAHEGTTVLAVRDEEVVGFAASSRDGTLEGLYVLPGEGGRGVGTALLDAVAPGVAPLGAGGQHAGAIVLRAPWLALVGFAPTSPRRERRP